MMFIACNTCDQIIAKRNESIRELCAAAEAHSVYSGHVCTATHDVDGDVCTDCDRESYLAGNVR